MHASGLFLYQKALKLTRVDQGGYNADMKLLQLMMIVPLALGAAECRALGSDRDQPIEIKADRAVLDDTRGVATYSGNVSVLQGSLHISADEVEVVSEENEVARIVASSNSPVDRPAIYQQQPDNSEIVTAKAGRIIYLVADELLKLEGSASLSQTTDLSFSGETIDYDLKRGIVNAKDGVTTTFTPRKAPSP